MVGSFVVEEGSRKDALGQQEKFWVRCHDVLQSSRLATQGHTDCRVGFRVQGFRVEGRHGMAESCEDFALGMKLVIVSPHGQFIDRR